VRLGAVPENFLERVLLSLGLLPTPFLYTHVAMLLSRTTMAATKLGVFDVLEPGPLGASEVACKCGTDPDASRKLLDALVGAGYLRCRRERYALAPVARKWLARGPRSLADQLMWQFKEWEWLESCEEFVHTGEPVMMHQRLSDEEWALYQRGMRSLAGLWAPEVAWRTPVPRGAVAMLDIGGSLGHYSVALCRRYPNLSSVVLDLPAAVAQAAPILAAEGMNGRVSYRIGDALTDDLGSEDWDLVLVSQLVHHFDEETNRELARRVAAALRPGGVFVVQDALHSRRRERDRGLSALYDLYFALTSKAGTWSYQEVAAWQREAGLAPKRPLRFITMPGCGQQSAFKPRSR
jgi:SAM-dependent methyltransferase